MLRAKNKPDISPISVVFENIFWINNFKSFIDKIITPRVDITIPLIPNLLNFSFNIKYSIIATWTTSVLLSEVPTTKFENLNKYNNTKVNITWKIDARVTFIKNPGWLIIISIIVKSLKYIKNKANAKGKAKENLT